MLSNKISVFVIIAFFQERVAGQIFTEYLGCYRDSNSSIAFKLNRIASNEEPAKRCKVFCFTEGYLHAAIKKGQECRCTDVAKIPFADDESLCNSTCVNDEKCGGEDAFSLHTTGIIEDLIEDLDDYEIGCLHENEDHRLIREHKADFEKTNSPRRCIAYCNALGYPHAGVQLQRECFCGLAKRTYPVVSGCNTACSGDRKQMCGGIWKMNVYSTGVTKPSPALALRGCFEMDKIKANLTKEIDEMIPNKCISHCYLNGLSFAHIYNGSTCLCSHSMPASKYKGNSAINCDINCSGNSDDQCGGEKFAITYSTGVSGGNPVLGKLLGCFKDKDESIISGSKQILKYDNSVETCISICMIKGYAFAGLRNTNECECSKSRPKRSMVVIVADAFCKTNCPKNPLQNCGAPQHVSLYRTGVEPSVDEDCNKSPSISNRKHTCSGQTMFEDDFTTLDRNKWQHSIKISGEDDEFVVYTSKSKNIFTKNGKLNIRPTLMPDQFIHNGFLQLKGCTESKDNYCAKDAKNFNIIPPIESGQICSRQSFNFVYGNITVRAKLPKGDWVVPQVWLKPTERKYGPGYMSGKLLIINSRGNPVLTDNSQDIGANVVESGFQVSTSEHGKIVSSTVSVTSTVPLYEDFVNYQVIWSPDKVQFYVNSAIVSGLRTIYDYSGATLLDEMDVDDSYIYRKTTNMSPFDEEFHICIGLYAGGRVNFPDKCITEDGKSKPWSNEEVKGPLKFWLKRNDWESTWSNETVFQIDSIKVTAL